jgi:hypothetical protein
VASLNKVIAKPPIVQGGTYGYLLWLRRDLPPVYAALAKQVPDVARFEAALVRQNAGLGQDLLTDDFSMPDLSPVAIDTPVAVDYADALATPTLTTSSGPIASDLSTVTIPSDVGGSVAGQVANGVSPSTLATIGATVAAILPTAIKAAATVGAAVINSQTASKALATAQLQYSAAVAGKAPLQTGIITTPGGVSYLAPIQSFSGLPSGSTLTDTLQASIAGVPLYVYLLGGAALLVLLASRTEP